MSHLPSNRSLFWDCAFLPSWLTDYPLNLRNWEFAQQYPDLNERRKHQTLLSREPPPDFKPNEEIERFIDNYQTDDSRLMRLNAFLGDLALARKVAKWYPFRSLDLWRQGTLLREADMQNTAMEQLEKTAGELVAKAIIDQDTTFFESMRDWIEADFEFLNSTAEPFNPFPKITRELKPVILREFLNLGYKLGRLPPWSTLKSSVKGKLDDLNEGNYTTGLKDLGLDQLPGKPRGSR